MRVNSVMVKMMAPGVKTDSDLRADSAIYELWPWSSPVTSDDARETPPPTCSLSIMFHEGNMLKGFSWLA